MSEFDDELSNFNDNNVIDEIYKKKLPNDVIILINNYIINNKWNEIIEFINNYTDEDINIYNEIHKLICFYNNKREPFNGIDTKYTLYRSLFDIYINNAYVLENILDALNFTFEAYNEIFNNLDNGIFDMYDYFMELDNNYNLFIKFLTIIDKKTIVENISKLISYAISLDKYEIYYYLIDFATNNNLSYEIDFSQIKDDILTNDFMKKYNINVNDIIDYINKHFDDYYDKNYFNEDYYSLMYIDYNLIRKYYNGYNIDNYLCKLKENNNSNNDYYYSSNIIVEILIYAITNNYNINLNDYDNYIVNFVISRKKYNKYNIDDINNIINYDKINNLIRQISFLRKIIHNTSYEITTNLLNFCIALNGNFNLNYLSDNNDFITKVFLERLRYYNNLSSLSYLNLLIKFGLNNYLITLYIKLYNNDNGIDSNQIIDKVPEFNNEICFVTFNDLNYKKDIKIELIKNILDKNVDNIKYHHLNFNFNYLNFVYYLKIHYPDNEITIKLINDIIKYIE